MAKERILSSPLSEIDGKKYSFTFSKTEKGKGKLIGINKVGTSGTVDTPVDPSGAEWNTISNSDEAKTAYNLQINHKDTGDDIVVADKDTLDTRFNQETKKFANQAAAQEERNQQNNINIATAAQKENSPAYAAYKESRGKKAFAEFYTYPLDIDPLQDHMKISKYKYKRPSVQGSRPATSTDVMSEPSKFQKRREARTGYKAPRKVTATVNKPGDSMLGSQLEGSVILPMPKVVDTNGAEWGESELNILGLAAASLAGKFI